MAQPCSIRQQRYKFNDSPSPQEMREVRDLWRVGVPWKEIRWLYNLRDAKLLEIIKMPENWESLAA